jgi:hypothetical protein
MRCARLVLTVGFVLLLTVSAAAQKPAAETGLEKVFDRPEALAALKQPTVCVLDIQHPDLILKQVAEKPVDQYASCLIGIRLPRSPPWRTSSGSGCCL